MRTYSDKVLILRRFPFGDANHVMSLFSEKNGRTKAVAKGTRKVGSKRSGHLDLFNLVDVQLRIGREMDAVEEATVLDSFEHAKTSLNATGCFYYVAELLEYLTALEEENTLLFIETIKLFEAIDVALQQGESEEAFELLLRDYEIFLLQNMGYWPNPTDYPSEVAKQRLFNMNLFRRIADRDFKSKTFFNRAV